jgi:GTP-binding protein
MGPGIPVYAGMVIGENAREDDLVVNVCKKKQLTNMRASGSDGIVKLDTPRDFSLERYLEYIESDELLEVTPKSLRLRKKMLDHNARHRERKKLLDLAKS